MKRIGIAVLILSACCVSVAWGQQPTCKAHTPWAEFHRYNMRRSNPCERVLNVHNVRNLGLKWSYTAGGTAHHSSPAEESDMVYIGSNDGNLYALDAHTGAKLWSYSTGIVWSSPAVANDMVYIGSSDGNVYALNAHTGAKRWSYATGNPVNSSPAVASGVLYVGSDSGAVYALNARTGAELWSYPTGSAVTSSPAVANGVVYVGSDSGEVYAFGLK